MRGYHINPTGADQAVLQVGQISFVGNIIPHTWYRTMKQKNGKPYFLAIVLLSDIVYWYRPIEIRDEQSGQFVGWRKKFKADKLQRSYQDFVEAFNVSRKQVKVAMDYLEEIGVIDRDFRTIIMNNRKPANNVLYIGINPKRLLELTYPHTLEGRRLLPSRVGGSYPRGKEAPTLEGRTNTEITTEITTQNYPAADAADRVSGNNQEDPPENGGNVKQPSSELLGNNSGMVNQQFRNGQPTTPRDVPSEGCNLCARSADAADRVFGNNKKKPKEDPLRQAITEVFKTAPGQTRAISRQMTGRTSKKNANHISDFDPPATPDEVRAFAKWWAREYAKINLPTSPAKLQNHFYAFRAGGKKKRRRRVSDGRWLEYDEDLRRWMDQGPAKVENGRIFIRESGKWCDIGAAPQKKGGNE